MCVCECNALVVAVFVSRVCFVRHCRNHIFDQPSKPTHPNSTMKTFFAASLLASAAAFAPSQKAASSTAMQSSFEGDFGAMLPLGFWDPLGLVADGDQAKFDRLRLTELKHGRIAMIAIVGNLISEAGIRFPGKISLTQDFADIPSGYAAIEAIPYAGKLQIFALIGALEVFVMRDFVGGEFPGTYKMLIDLHIFCLRVIQILTHSAYLNFLLLR